MLPDVKDNEEDDDGISDAPPMPSHNEEYGISLPGQTLTGRESGQIPIPFSFCTVSIGVVV